MVEQTGRATVSVGDGNGGTKLVVDMKVWQWVLSTILAVLAIFGGAYQGVYLVSTQAAHNWYEKDGRIKVSAAIDAKIDHHTIMTESTHAADLLTIHTQLATLTALITTTQTE